MPPKPEENRTTPPQTPQQPAAQKEPDIATHVSVITAGATVTQTPKALSTLAFATAEAPVIASFAAKTAVAGVDRQPWTKAEDQQVKQHSCDIDVVWSCRLSAS